MSAKSNSTNSGPANEEKETWMRVADLCQQAGVSPNTGRRWARSLPEGQAEKRDREVGGRGEWWVQADLAEDFLRKYARDPSNAQSAVNPPSIPQPQAPSTTLVLAQVESRLARIEGVLAGQWISELSERLRELTEANQSLRQELIASREEARQREAELATVLQEIRHREEQLGAQGEAIRKVLSRPSWWQRLWPKKKSD